MEKIPSFTVDHIHLLTGLYVSRVDDVGGNPVTTLDIRMTRPNLEPPMDTAGVHAIEHLGATWLRNEPQWRDKIIYFGPMGCRTGFYLIVNGLYQPEAILDCIAGMIRFIMDYAGEIPGASARDCGNYLDMNLSLAQYYARKYWTEVIERPVPERFHYPA